MHHCLQLFWSISVSFAVLGFPIVNDPLYNHVVFGPEKGKDGNIGKSDEELIQDLITIHNAENWLGGDGDEFAPSFFSGGGVTDDNSLGTTTPTDVKIDHQTEQTVSPLPSQSPAAVPQAEPTQTQVAVDTQDESTATEPEIAALTATVTAAAATTAPAAADPAASNSSVDDSAQEKATGEPADSLTKTDQALADQPADSTYDSDKLTCDEHCYECKVRFRDPKPRDLMMFLHAWRYKGPGWSYETQLPPWAQGEWQHQEF